MTTNDKLTDITKQLPILKNEDEFIIKPFHSETTHDVGMIECGKIVSRTNKSIFDYQIGDTSLLSSNFKQKVILSNPETKQVVLELYHNRLPFLCKVCCKQDVRCLLTRSSEIQPIGIIEQRLTFSRVWYDVYNSKCEHVVSIMLRKRHLKGKIQHRVLEFEILDNDERTKIGGIYPYSTDLIGSEYGQAVAMKIPQNMNVEIKATLLINALILKSRLN